MSTPVTPAPEAAASTPLKKTALNATHRALKAKMVDFGGWDMPVEYPGPGGGLIAEHMAVRTGVGLFDVSHMGEIQFRGPGALAAVQHITMNDASKLKDGQAHYSALLTPAGHVCRRHPGPPAQPERLPAGGERRNQGQGLRLDSQAGGRFPSIHISDYSSYYSQLALQGPRALETLQKLTKVDLAAIKNYWFTWGTVAGDSQRADRAHRLLRRRRLRGLHSRRRGHHGEDVERAAGSGRGVRHSALRAGRAQHPAA